MAPALLNIKYELNRIQTDFTNFGINLEDVRNLRLASWPRLGGKGCFVQLYGMEGVTGMYIAEIPGGAVGM